MPDTRTRPGWLLVLDRAGTALGIVLLVAAAALAPILAGINGMRSDACDGSCRYDLVGVGSGIIAVTPAAVLIAVVAVLLIRAPSGRPLAWICGLGLAIDIAAIVIGDAMITSGVGG